MNKVLAYFNNLNDQPYFAEYIKAYGYKKSYKMRLCASPAQYLFEDLKITKKFAKEGAYARPGTKKVNRFITIHDTGDTLEGHGSAYWAYAVANGKLKDTGKEYLCSYQYVVGNEGIYHLIPDDEVAYHAGDGTKVSFNLQDTGLTFEEGMQGVIGINKKGFYTIDGKATQIKAPVKEEDGKEKILDASYINDGGLILELDGDKLMLAETYYNAGYDKICTRGGNNNSIGIEIVVAKGENIYYNLQQAAKLVARLLEENYLYIDDIKQHNFFSGKNCPQTLRENNLWEYFLGLVQIEIEVREFIKEGYKIEFIPEMSFLNKNGTMTHLPSSVKGIKYTISTTFGEEKDDYTFVKLI